MLTVVIYGEETKAATIKYKESILKRETTILLVSIPLTLTYSLLSYKFFKMYQRENPNYSLTSKETKNVIYIGLSLSMLYTLCDYFNYKKKAKNDNKSRKRKRKNR